MELNQAFATLEKQLAAINTELHFNREAGAEDALTFAGDNGLYRLHYVASSCWNLTAPMRKKTPSGAPSPVRCLSWTHWTTAM